MSYSAEHEQLVQRAMEMGDNPAAVPLLEDAIRIADGHLDSEHSFATRQQLIRLCFATGQPTQLMVAMAWCLSAMDKNLYEPDEYELRLLLWQCKHCVTYAPRFATISYEKFDRLFKDVLARYAAAGVSPRFLYMLAGEGELFMGHTDVGRDYLKRGWKQPRDWSAESSQWELFVKVAQCSYEDDDERALELMETVLADPSKADDVYPWFVNEALYPLLTRGRKAEAFAHQKRVYRSIKGNPKFTCHASTHMSFLAVIGELEDALAILASFAEHGMSAADHWTRLWFQLHGWFLMERLLKAGEDTLPVELLPDSFAETCGSSSDVRQISRAFERGFRELIEQFAERNGNRYVDLSYKEVAERLDWEP